MKLANILGMLALLVAGAVWADGVVKEPVKADTAEKFSAAAAEVRQEMTNGGRYEFINADGRARVEKDLTDMAAMLQASQSVDRMRPADKVALLNLQENLNGILAKNDNNRLVCEHSAPLGSHIQGTSCQTVGQIERRRRESQKYMDDHDIDANVNSAAFHAARPGKGG
jgi:choline dehydrogenase-like flavoprotein